jgi:hypothetical protein
MFCRVLNEIDSMALAWKAGVRHALASGGSDGTLP